MRRLDLGCTVVNSKYSRGGWNSDSYICILTVQYRHTVRPISHPSQQSNIDHHPLRKFSLAIKNTHGEKSNDHPIICALSRDVQRRWELMMKEARTCRSWRDWRHKRPFAVMDATNRKLIYRGRWQRRKLLQRGSWWRWEALNNKYGRWSLKAPIKSLLITIIIPHSGRS